MNLNGILSSRLLAPRDSFGKYYADLLAFCPGWVPLLKENARPSAIRLVTSERGAGGPVLVELSDQVIDRPSTDGSVSYVRAVPFSKFTAIHFPDEKGLREHRARGYKNVQPHEDLLRVSPELFSSDTDEDLEISAPAGEASPTNWTLVDRVRGAVNGLLAACESGEALAMAATVLGAAPVSGQVFAPPWLNWDCLAGDPVTLGNEDAASTADRLIFEAAYRVLGRSDKAESWSPTDILDQVTDEIAAVDAGGDVQRIVTRNLQRIGELLNVEREFEPFRNPDSPHVAAKSLLMVLLRPDLEQLLAWPATETGADETTRSVAAVLAGRLRGLSRETVKLRNATLDDLTAEWATRVASGSAIPVGSASFVATEFETHLFVNGVRVMEAAPLLPDPVLLYKAMSEKGRPAARVGVSRSLGWPVVVRVSVPPGSEVEVDSAMITITSVKAVNVDIAVDEPEFLGRLSKVRGEARRQVAGLLQKSKTSPTGPGTQGGPRRRSSPTASPSPT